jgi:hypothetical protein
MDIFANVLLAGFALAYFVELLGAFLRSYRSDKLFKHLITPPLAFAACWYLNIVGFSLVVAGLATCFIATALRIVLDAITSKPQVIQRRF